MRRRFVFALWAAVVAPACGGRQAPAGPPEPLVVHYARQARPRTDYELEIPPHGYARIAARRTLSSRPDGAAGYFGAPLKKTLRKEIESRVSQARLLDRHDEPDLSEKDGGFLRLARGSQKGEVSLSAQDEASGGLRSLLDELVSRSIDRPVASLRLQAKARLDGPTAKVSTRFLHQGEQAIEIAITHETEPASFRVMLERGGRLVDEMLLGPSDIERLATAGRLPRGWHTVAPGTAFTPLPFQMTLPADYRDLFARIEASFWVRTKGRSPIRIALTSASVSVDPEEDQER